MTGVKTSLCSVAVVLACSQSVAMAAAPFSDGNNGFDQWSVSSGTITISDIDATCPTGWTCSPAVTGHGFYQRQVDDGSGNSYFQTIVTERGSNSYVDDACYAPLNPDPTVLSFSEESFIRTSGSIEDLTQQTTVTSGDTTPPSITSPGDITRSVNGYANFIQLDPNHGGQQPTVSDNNTMDFDRSPAKNAVIGPLAPGRHTLTWEAKDAARNSAQTKQTIDILPSVNFEIDQITGEDSYVSVIAHLSGDAPEYPVTIPYTVSGNATGEANVEINNLDPNTDHNAGDGVITIESGTRGEVYFYVADNSLTNVIEADETIVFTMGTPANAVAGNKTEHHVTILQTPKTLTLDMHMAQGVRPVSLIGTDDDLTKITLTPRNLNAGQSISFDWSQSHPSLVGSDCTKPSFYVDPGTLSPGLYRIHATVSETDYPDQGTSAEWWLRVTASTLIYSGDNDWDGIPNNLDTTRLPHLIPGYPVHYYSSLKDKILRNQHGAQAAQLGWSMQSATSNINYPMLIAAAPGLKLSAGNTHLETYESTENATLPMADFTFYDDIAATGPVNLSDATNHLLVSLKISQMAVAGGNAQLVIPQPEIMDNQQSVYSYTPAFGWRTFLEDNNNVVATSMRLGDYCPPPGSSNYQPGLQAQFECLQLTLEDGGPNDADGYRNGNISFNGGTLVSQSAIEDAQLRIVEAEQNLLLATSQTEAETANTRQNEIIELKPAAGGGAILFTSLLCLLGLKRRPKLRKERLNH